MTGFLKLTSGGNPVLVNIDQITSMRIHRAIATGNILGTEIFFGHTGCGGEGNSFESYEISVCVNESFDDIKRAIGGSLGIIEVETTVSAT